MSPDADPGNRESTHHYESPLPLICHACQAVETRVAEYEDHAAAKAMRFRAIKIPHTAEEG